MKRKRGRYYQESLMNHYFVIVGSHQVVADLFTDEGEVILSDQLDHALVIHGQVEAYAVAAYVSEYLGGYVPVVPACLGKSLPGGQ